jgi:hypothetical protein
MSSGRPSAIALLDAVTATGAGPSHSLWGDEKSFQVSHSTSSGAGSATVIVQVSNDGSAWIDAATFTLTLSSSVGTEGFTRNGTWKFVRGYVSAISGTDAQVTLTVSNLTR